MTLDAARAALHEALEANLTERQRLRAAIAALSDHPAVVSAYRPPELTTTLTAPPTVTADVPLTKLGPPKPVEKYDKAEVAAVATAAIEAGESAPLALMARYGCTRTTATWLIAEARRQGHHIPAAGTGRPPQNAVGEGSSDRRHDSAAGSGSPLSAARPAVEAAKPGTQSQDIAPGAACHVCDDCGTPHVTVAAIGVHAHTVHHRPPSPTERRFSIYEPDGAA